MPTRGMTLRRWERRREPLSCVSTLARSSTRAAMPSATLSSRSARSAGANPAQAGKAAAAAYRECSLSLVKNGVYGGMFVAGCVAAALSKNPTVETILQSGLSVIPEKCRLAESVSFVREQYQLNQDFEAIAKQIETRYNKYGFAGTVNNLAFVTLGLLHGNLDYTKTITTAVMCGHDTDCNSGTAGSIAAAAQSYRSLDQRWIAPLHDTVKTVVAHFGQGTVSELIERTIKVRNQLNGK